MLQRCITAVSNHGARRCISGVNTCLLSLWHLRGGSAGSELGGQKLADTFCVGLVCFAGSWRGFAVKARHRGTVFVPRRESRQSLYRSRRHRKDDVLLLPPWVSATELRIIFRLDYAGIFRLLGVRQEASKFYWRDLEGRTFESSSKRKVLVPYDMAAMHAHALGYKPKLVDAEPDWEVTSAGTAGAGARSFSKPVPVVAVLGHINHGKTTLLDALCGTAVAAQEPGGITQDVRAMTGQMFHSKLSAAHRNDEPAGGEELLPLVALGERGVEESALSQSDVTGGAQFDRDRLTFLDTPGHEAFELLRGRTMAAADCAVVVVSLERGAEVQTEEVLLHAARWKVPVVFALNKVDLPEAHVELTRAELRRQCQRLLEHGLVNVDWTEHAEAAVPISALHRLHLDKLVGAVHQVLAEQPSLPLRPLVPPTSTPGEGRRCADVPRRTDFLVGIEPPPVATALVVEVERGSESGVTMLTLLVRNGRLLIGQYFVVGTVFGRISRLSVAQGFPDEWRWVPTQSATSGVAVHLTGLRSKELGGDCTVDDVLYVFPKERAWRLSEHRRRIETLATLQTGGPNIAVSWEHDSPSQQLRTQAVFDRSRRSQPEQHSASAYQMRQQMAAVDEYGAEHGAPNVFAAASREAFVAPFEPDEGFKAEPEPVQVAPGGRKSKRRLALAINEEQSPPDAESTRRFKLLAPTEEARGATRDLPDEPAKAGGGRRSNKPSLGPSGAWAEGAATDPPDGKDFVYYAERRSWDEEASIDSGRVRSRWQWRDEARWAEEERKERLRQEEKRLTEATRRAMFGEPPLSAGNSDSEGEPSASDDEEAEPLPAKHALVVPMILKTKSISQFDVLMDEIEQLQTIYGVRIAIVHGGLGPVSPKDVIHAEIEKQYGFCPIYAFQVGVHAVAFGQADKASVDIRRFDVFTDLVADVTSRCERIHSKQAQEAYVNVLRRQSTSSGL